MSHSCRNNASSRRVLFQIQIKIKIQRLHFHQHAPNHKAKSGMSSIYSSPLAPTASPTLPLKTSDQFADVVSAATISKVEVENADNDNIISSANGGNSKEGWMLPTGISLIVVASVILLGFFALSKFYRKDDDDDYDDGDSRMLKKNNTCADRDVEMQWAGEKSHGTRSHQDSSSWRSFRWLKQMLTSKTSGDEQNTNWESSDSDQDKQTSMSGDTSENTNYESSEYDQDGETPSSSHTNVTMDEMEIASSDHFTQISALTVETSLASSCASDEIILNKFSSGGMMGDELAKWCKKMRPVLPSIKSLVLSILDQYGEIDSIGKCQWAHRKEFGTALNMMVRGNKQKQVQILCAIQEYCSRLGYPEAADSSGDFLIDNMFKSMYEYFIVSPEAFFMWSNNNNSRTTKTLAVVQTIEWFQWLVDEHGENNSIGTNP